MRFKHRSPVVALGALCLVACLSLLPATSGAFPIRWGETGDTAPGDPDSPTGGGLMFQLPMFNLRIAFYSTFIPGRGVLVIPRLTSAGSKALRFSR